MKTFIRLLKLAIPYKIMVIIASISSILFGLFNAMSLWVVGSLIGTIMGAKDNLSEHVENSSIIHKYLGIYFENIIENSSPIDQLKIVCVFLFCSYIMKNIFYYINWLSLSFIELKVITNIRNTLYSKIQNFPVSYFDKKRTGELLSIMLNDVTSITIAFSKSFQVFFHEIINMLILVILLILLSPKLTLMILITLPFSAFIILQISNSIKRKAMKSSLKIADISSIISEKVSGIRIVKAFNMTINEIKFFIRNNHNFYQLQIKQRKLLGLTTPVNDIIGVILACFLIWFGGQQVIILKTISPDNFMRFIIFLFALLQPARKLAGAIVAIQTGLVGAERAFSILDIKEQEKSDAGLIEKHEFKNKIEFKNIFFKYEEKGKQILNNVSVTIQKGEKIALVGSSGAGKTTFANLLLDFYNPDSGEILIDNQNINTLTTTSIRKMISIVPQEPILFNDTIKNNLSYGLKNVDNNLIIKAAENANILDHIESLSNKFETIIGENGVMLSGGQKQRVAIGRAILRDPSILVLDEATSSLDSESEIKVQNAIDQLILNRTVIVIAHRLSTIINSDKILVFDKGAIIEQGTHEELYNMNGVYTKLYNFQFQGTNE